MVTLTLPDPDDRHVLAAAGHCGATALVTFNLKDFPADTLAPFGVEAVHPDEFVVRLLAEQTELVCEAVQRQRANLKRPAKTVEELLATFVQCGLPRTAAALLRHAESL